MLPISFSLLLCNETSRHSEWKPYGLKHTYNLLISLEGSSSSETSNFPEPDLCGHS